MLRQKGLTHVAFELLPTDMQPLLERYHELRKDHSGDPSTIQMLRNELIEHFCGVWGTDDQEEQEGLRKMAQKLTDMVDTMVANSIHVLAIEPPIPRPFVEGHGYSFMHSGLEALPATSQRAFDQYWTRNSSDTELSCSRNELRSCLVSGANWNEEDANRFLAILDGARLAEPQIDLKGLTLPRPEDRPGNFDQCWGDLTDLWRDQTWMSAIEDVLRISSTQVLVFAGGGHFGFAIPPWPETKTSTRTFNEIIQDKGHDVTVVGFAGGDYPRKMMAEVEAEFGCPREQGMILTDAACEAGVGDQSFAILMQNEGSRRSDWVVHLPRSPEL